MGLTDVHTSKADLDPESLLHRIINRIRRSLELQDILMATAAEVRSFLGTDRIMIYQFHADASGQVIAESIYENRLPSLLGLNFPADDIPPHARELFIKSQIRSIVDVTSGQIGQSPLQEGEPGTTVADTVHYRSADSCHIEYLTAMGVQSSVVLPIMHQEQLWGLLVSHHSEPRSIPDTELQALQMVSDQLSVAIAQSELLKQARHQARREATINQISALLHSLSTIELQDALEETVVALQGSGGRLYIDPATLGPNNAIAYAPPTADEDAIRLYTCGAQPVMPTQAMFPLMEQYSIWQSHFSSEGRAWPISDLYKISGLRNLQPAFKPTKIRGILIVPLQYRQQFLGYLSIFRDEIDTETLWAGQFDPDQRQVQPRLSFEMWCETKQGQAEAWTAEEIDLAEALSNHFAAAIHQYDMHQQVQALNASLEQQVQERTAKLRLATEQQQVLFEVVTKIRESLDLKTIFNTAAKEVRRALAADRVGIFQFKPDSNFAQGEFVAEDILLDFPPILTEKVQDHCFGEQYAARYQKGRMQVVSDVYTAGLQECHVAILERFQIRANLVVPLIKAEGLWGLLCIHQCAHPRQWDPSEIQFVTQVAAQLGVALQQADLLAQTQHQAEQLAQALDELQKAQTQLIQTEKMSSLGQLVAGVAHEINNPVNFIYGNLSHASEYAKDLLRLIGLYQEHYPDPVADIQAQTEAIDLDFVTEDLSKIMTSMQVGTDRIRQIVQSLRNFSHLDQAEMKRVDIHDGLESTLLILHHRLREQVDALGIEVIKEYGDLPRVECYAGQLNQVFMNVLSNAVDALEERRQATTREDDQPTIWIQTAVTRNNRISIQIRDNGPGIPEVLVKRIFDPFFSTKPIGKGTGLGLSISYQIVVDKHGGVLECRSQIGQGTAFSIEIPISQSDD